MDKIVNEGGSRFREALAETNNLLEATIVPMGPVAKHNFPCPVCRKKHAILDLSIGVFKPCWKCQEDGWEVKKKLSLWDRMKYLFLS